MSPPNPDLGVHPGELVVFLPLSQQAIVGIDADTETRTLQMMRDDVGQFRQQLAQKFAIGSYFEITLQRVKKPQRRVRGMINPFLLALRKKVWNQPVANMFGKYVEYAARLAIGAR